jgi:hypothetical protein
MAFGHTCGRNYVRIQVGDQRELLSLSLSTFYSYSRRREMSLTSLPQRAPVPGVVRRDGAEVAGREEGGGLGGRHAGAAERGGGAVPGAAAVGQVEPGEAGRVRGGAGEGAGAAGPPPCRSRRRRARTSPSPSHWRSSGSDSEDELVKVSYTCPPWLEKMGGSVESND